jgi:penicillin-binding protein 2
MRSSGFDAVSIEILSRRLKIVTLCVIAAFVVLVSRLWFLQILNGPSYRDQSDHNRIRLQDIPPARGKIFDRNGELLVDNRPSYNLYIIPEEIQHKEQLLESLRRLIGLDPEEVKTRLDKASRLYPFKPIPVKRDMSREELAIIETQLYDLPGVDIQLHPQRYYIHKSFASHLIGYLGEISEEQLNSGEYNGNKAGDLIGKDGVEKKWQKDLFGIRGGAQVERDAVGRNLKVMSRKPATPGLNVWLTIDKNLQMTAEAELAEKRGAIVALNPNNGEILAFASSPSFDPNAFIDGLDKTEWERLNSTENTPLLNRAISGQYPPGSIFKIVVALAALEEGVIDPEEEVYCTGSYRVGTKDVRSCWKKGGHGKVSLYKAIVGSCDVYFYRLGQLLDVDTIARYSKAFGLGKKTGFEIGSEKPGLVPTSEWKLKSQHEPWQPGETISLAIGQSFLQVTPLQAAGMISAMFNGGYLYQPKAVKRVGRDETSVYEFTPTVKGQVRASPENMELIKKALIGVVNETRGSTGRRARVKGISVAGKTGTVQVVGLKKAEALEEEGEVPVKFRDHAWFVAIAPAEDPALALAILVEHAGEGGSGAAAPIAKEMFEAYLGKEQDV